MSLKFIAIVSEIQQVSASELTSVSAALQKQVLRDFAPIWNEPATVDAFLNLEDVPLGYWPVIILDNIGFPGAAGIHQDKDGQPFGLVQYSRTWPLTASHEILEMLADPFGNRVIAGNSIKLGQGRVEYLVEVCDPSEAFQFGYQVNGIQLSDFYTPNYFDPVKAAGVRYSFTGAIQKPREVLKGGYLSWRDPATDHWWQQDFLGAKKFFRDLGIINANTLRENIRFEIDRLTDAKEKIHGATLPTAIPRRRGAALMAAAAAPASNTSKADTWRLQIEELKREYTV